jgi:sulfatase modifying factor 1
MSVSGPQTGSPPASLPLNPAQPAAVRVVAIEDSYDPAQPQIRIPRKVVKGGSFLYAPNYCRRCRRAARRAQMKDSDMSDIGFHCITPHPAIKENGR